MKNITISILILWTTLLHSYARREPQYDITTLKYNPGIYFEFLSPLRYFQTEWRVAAALRVDDLINQRPNVEEQYRLLKESAKDYIPYTIPVDTQNLIKEIASADRYVDILRGSLKARISAKLKHRRSAPLGIIGQISHGLFGTLTEEDGELYLQEIAKLQDKQKESANLLEKQTHVIRSEFQEIHEHLDRLNFTTTYLLNQTTNTLQCINEVNNKVYYTQYKLRINEWVQEMRHQINEYRASILLLTDAILFARRGLLHPAILTPIQLLQIAKEIREATQLDLPLTEQELLTENIEKVARIESLYHQGQLYVTITFPLITPETHKLYKLIPYPSLQQNNTLALFIQPHQPYLIITQDQKYYTFTDLPYLTSCKQHQRQYLCPSGPPLHNIEYESTCEPHLLLNLESPSWEKCDVRTVTFTSGFWSQLEETGHWLYSIPRTEELKIICKDQVVNFQTLKGNGILKLHPDCKAETKAIRMESLKSLSSSKSIYYEPIKNIKISEIIPDKLHNTIHKLLQENPPQPNQATNWNNNKNGLALSEIESQAKNLQLQENHAHTLKLTTYASTGIVSTVFILITALFIFYVRRTKNQPKQIQHLPSPIIQELNIVPEPRPMILPTIHHTQSAPTQQQLPELPLEHRTLPIFPKRQIGLPFD